MVSAFGPLAVILVAPLVKRTSLPHRKMSALEPQAMVRTFGRRPAGRRISPKTGRSRANRCLGKVRVLQNGDDVGVGNELMEPYALFSARTTGTVCANCHCITGMAVGRVRSDGE